LRRLIPNLIALLLLSLPVSAHDYWLKPIEDGAKLVYGHAQESEPYKKSVMKIFKAEDSEVAPTYREGVFTLKAPKAAIFLAEVDDGPWVKTIRGWRRGTKEEHNRVLRSTWDRYYAKLSRGKDRAVGLPLEIILDPNQAPGNITGKVLFRGKPLDEANLEIEHSKVGETGKDGKFQLNKSPGKLLILRVAHKEKLSNNKDIDWSTHVCTLTFQP